MKSINKYQLNIDFDSINILKNKNIDLSKYENIVIGSCIYVGQINKELKKFMMTYHDALIKKYWVIPCMCI